MNRMSQQSPTSPSTEISKAGLLACYCLLVASCFARASDTPFIHALRQRGLQRLADVQCLQALQEPALTDRQVAELVALRSQIIVDLALAASPTDRQPHWSQAQKILKQQLASTPRGAARLLLNTQQALNLSTQGEVEQLEATVRGKPIQHKTSALRLALRQWEAIADQVEQLRQTQARQPTIDFTTRELDSLANRAALHHAQVLSLVASGYAPGSADRDDALLQALQHAERLAARSLPPDLLWQARLSVIKSHRQLGKPAAAQERLSKWLSEGPQVPAPVAGWYAAEQAWLYQIADQSDTLQKWLADLTPEQRRSPEMAIYRIETAASKLQSSHSDVSISKLRAMIGDEVSHLESHHGPVWSMRAAAVAGRALARTFRPRVATPAPGDADALYHAGQFDLAVEAYDSAAAIAYQRGARGRSFELALASAAIRQSQGAWTDAATRFRRAALANATHPDAPMAHRSAAVCWSERLRKLPQEENLADWDRYFDLLEEHLAAWPQADSALELRWWLIESLAVRGQWRRALGVLRQVPTGDPRRDESLRLRGEAWSEIVASTTSPQPKREALSNATRELLPIITGNENRWPLRWSPAQRETAVTISKLRLRYGESTRGPYAEKLLRAALNGAPAADPRWRSVAEPLLAAALVQQGKLAEAKQRLASHPPQNRMDALSLLEELQSLQARSQTHRKAAGALTLATLAALPEESDSAWQLPYKSQALASAGNSGDALRAARRMADTAPNDLEAMRGLASLLAQQTSEDDRREALSLWHKLEQQGNRGSKAWFRARLARIKLQVSLGEADQAGKLLKLTQLLHPDLGGMGEQFQAAVP